MASRKTGKVVKPAGVRPWPHEERVADILALAGHIVEFIPESNIKTADIFLDGVQFEIKSPLSNNINAVGRNLNRGSKQSPNIIFDTSRMKGVRYDCVVRVLKTYLIKRKDINRILLINKRGQIIDINNIL